MPEFIAAGPTDLGAGEGKIVTVKDCDIALFNVDGAYYAVENECPHRGGPIGEGELSGKTVTCPWHAFQFDVTTGENDGDPGLKLKCFPVKLEGGKVMVGMG